MTLGAVESLISQEVGGRFTIRDRTLTITTTVQEVLLSNPERAGYLVLNTGAVRIQFGWSRPLVSPGALPFGANGGGLAVSVREDFVLPIFPAYAVVASGTSTLLVVEITRISGSIERVG